MDSSFWLHKWEKNEIAFHEINANPALIKHFKNLSLPKTSRIFLPLCGKTLDIEWLLSKSYQVAGAELSALAVEQLFKNLGVKPKISKIKNVQLYSAKNIDIFVGNIFDLSKTILGPIDAIYDRAALVALPKEMRKQYTKHLTKTTNNAPQLLLSFEYDQKLMKGPPFSVTNEEIKKHYQKSYKLTHLASNYIVGGLKGHSARENVWLLQNN